MPELTLDSLVTGTNDQTVRVRDLPPWERELLGFGHGQLSPDDQWRATDGRLPGPWPDEPDTCRYPSPFGWVWTRDAQDLFCPGCGMNGT